MTVNIGLTVDIEKEDHVSDDDVIRTIKNYAIEEARESLSRRDFNFVRPIFESLYVSDTDMSEDVDGDITYTITLSSDSHFAGDCSLLGQFFNDIRIDDELIVLHLQQPQSWCTSDDDMDSLLTAFMSTGLGVKSQSRCTAITASGRRCKFNAKYMGKCGKHY